jgi:hypothetical protein
MRRNKNDMRLMENECTYYLLQTGNNPHKAYDLFIKEHLESNQTFPYYVKGMKDFLKVSQDLAIKLNQKEQMKKADQNRVEQKEIIIKFIMDLSATETYKLYKEYKDKVTQSEKLVLLMYII